MESGDAMARSKVQEDWSGEDEYKEELCKVMLAKKVIIFKFINDHFYNIFILRQAVEWGSWLWLKGKRWRTIRSLWQGRGRSFL